MPQGERRGTEVDLLDFTYDGEQLDTTHKYLKGGLGQLTDLRKGESNFRLDPHNSGYKVMRHALCESCLLLSLR